jgi:hypothetical protein
MNNAKIEAVIWSVFLIAGYFWMSFYSKSQWYFITATGLVTAYYVYVFLLYPIVVKSNEIRAVTYSASPTGHKISKIFIGLATIGLIWSILSRSLVWNNRNEFALIALFVSIVACCFLLLTFLWKNWRWSRAIVIRALLLLVVQFTLLGITDTDMVKWQYRDYPLFIQTFECWQLDPNNIELQHALKTEHMRIVLNESEFKYWETQHKLEIKGKNSW